MNLPINGRVAIIDDQINHAEPLMKILSQRQIPFTYFSGEYDFLPTEAQNDFRILFLDINLIDNGEHKDAVIKSKLLPVLKSIIAKDNYPYILIYWSRHQNRRDKNLIEKQIFQNELKDRKPIAFLSAIKSDYFKLDGTATDDFGEKINHLFETINTLISNHHAFGYLLNWENKVHISADKSLEELFSSNVLHLDWSNNANYIINSLGLSFAGKYYSSQNAEEKIKSSYNALNIVFTDALENTINKSNVHNAKKLKVAGSHKNLATVNNINKKLLVSDETEPMGYSGSVIEISHSKYAKDFENMLNVNLNDTGKKKTADIIKTYRKIWINVTPLCDSVQGKVIFHRLIRGLLVLSFKDIKKSFNNSEAFFISPSFTYENKDYVLILDFRQFFTVDQIGKSRYRKPLFRVRQQLLSEIQSKLSRHISRQGVLFLENK
ncbi:MAG: hypothetical protein K9I70_01790 [Chitinophagaceae bacterium]|nr:hypothetical protein [Chitinophagaceae bacterium]